MRKIIFIDICHTAYKNKFHVTKQRIPLPTGILQNIFPGEKKHFGNFLKVFTNQLPTDPDALRRTFFREILPARMDMQHGG
jgi:hypothetical protein